VALPTIWILHWIMEIIKMKPKVLSIILIFSLALNLAVIGTFIFRQFEPPLWPGDRPSAGSERMPFNRMDLNKEQRDEMTRLMHQFREVNRENRRMIFDLEDELMQTMRADEFDSLKIDSLVNRIARLRIDQSKQAIRHFIKIKKFLTPEQQEHFHQMIMDRPARFGNRGRSWRAERGMENMRPGMHPDSVRSRNR
jgi:Spy/CpxP family protein refolding chaperone